MKKLLVLLIAVTLAVGGYIFFLQGEKNDNNEKPVVKIGIILPLTGNTSNFGQAYKNGILLAEDNLNKNTKFTYKLIIEDSADNNKVLPAITRKLLDVDKVEAILIKCFLA